MKKVVISATGVVLAALFLTGPALADDRDRVSAEFAAVKALEAMQGGDEKMMMESTGMDAEAMKPMMMKAQERFKSAGHDALADWKGDVKGVFVEGDTATVWFCKAKESMFTVELTRDGRNWQVADVALYSRQ